MATEAAKALEILVCTANMGNAEPTAASMNEWIPARGDRSQVNVVKGQKNESEKKNFDIIFIGMQEATFKRGKPSAASVDEDDEDLEATQDSVAELDVSESSKRAAASNTSLKQMASNLSERAAEALQTYDSVQLRGLLAESLGLDYQLVAQQLRGQMRLYLYARREMKLKDIQVRGENTGIGHVLANKGGIVVSFTYEDTRFSFLTAHLAAHEGESYYQARCSNVREILRGTKIKDSYDVAITSHCMFVCGDLNFRTKFPQDETKTKEEKHEENVKRALAYIEKKDWGGLYAFDELHEGVDKGDLLRGFKTLPCDFPPTFKVHRQEGLSYKDQRTPSYTDRVLYQTSNTPVAQWGYEACPMFATSDHKPVRAAFTVQPNSMVPSITIPPTHLIFSGLKCQDLPAMDVDGSSDPYLLFALDPDVRVHKKTSRRNLRPVPHWDRTPYLEKNLNPTWDDAVDVMVQGEICADARLWITCMDYDATSKDDLMGTLSLNVMDLVSGESGSRSFNEPLIKYGRSVGWIRFTLDVRLKDGSVPASGDTSITGKTKSWLGLKNKQKS